MMGGRREIVLVLSVLAMAAAPARAAEAPRVSVVVPPGHGDQPIDGRLLLLLSTDPAAEPRLQIAESVATQMVFGMDVDGVRAGQPIAFDTGSPGYPIWKLSDVPAGDYYVQVVLHRYETFHRADGHTVKLPMDRGEGQHWNLAPGNLYSTPQKVTIGGGAAVTVSLDKEIPPIPEAKDTKYIRHLKIQSALLTKFWGRPMFLSANVLVPEGFDQHPNARFPLMIFEDHFNQDFGGFRTEPPDPNLKPDHSERFHLEGYNRIQQDEAYKFYQQWIAPQFPRFLVAQINHANPYYDDSYAVNSANLGPYGDAIENELIPAIEKQFRGIGQGWARFVYGGSTGGWEAMAVQLFYPDHYNGAFIACPDPVDFRAYTTVNIYDDKNAFVMQGPHTSAAAARHAELPGRDARHSKEHESAGARRSGHTRAPANSSTSGRPSSVLQETTDIRSRSSTRRLARSIIRSRRTGRSTTICAAILQREWSTLGPKVQGKLHIYVGSADTYFLEQRGLLPRRLPEDDQEPVVRRRGAVRRARGALLERRSDAAERVLAPALQHDVPAEDSRAHQADGASRRRSDVLEVLTDGRAPEL